MNFRQIKMLNDLEAKVAELDQFKSREEADWEAIGLQEKLLKEFEDRIVILEEKHNLNRIRIEKLENPPKRPRGRPRKIVNG